MPPQFIKVRKANKNRDRGIIAVDAICSAFEDKDSGKISIMTMDGYWYECDDDIEDLYSVITNGEGTQPPSQSKFAFVKSKRMPAPAISEKGGESPLSTTKEQHHESDVVVHRSWSKKSDWKRKPFFKQRRRTDIAKNLPSGDGEGQYNLDKKRRDAETPRSSDPLKGL